MLGNQAVANRVAESQSWQGIARAGSFNRESKAMIENTGNIKHNLILRILYGCGLRVSEVVNLKKEDINFLERLIHIRMGKGRKLVVVVVVGRWGEARRRGEKDHLHPSVHPLKSLLFCFVLLNIESQSMYLQAVRFSVSGRKCPSSPE